MSVIRIPNQRLVINRRELAASIAAAVAEHGGKSRPAVLALLRDALAAGRAEIGRRLVATPSAGHEIAKAQAFLIDQLVRVIHDHVTTAVYPMNNRSTGERLAVLAVGGYGRGEMAPHSDVDIAFITPIKQTPWCEQVIEAMLYFLWDLALKVGHSSRSLDEMVRMCRQRPDHPHRDARGALRLGRPGALSRGRRTASGTRSCRAPSASSSPRSSPSARSGTSASGDSALRRRAQRQGGQGRPARPPHALLDRQVHPQGARTGRAGRGRAADPAGIPRLPPRRDVLLGGALPSARRSPAGPRTG